jgi:hypothetical protein
LKLNKNQGWTLFLAGLGYCGAAVFYSQLVGTHAQAQIACPVCPNIDSLGSPVYEFVRRVLVLGTLNAFCFLLIGWLVITFARFIRRVA